ncbi:MAG: LexA family transcriptional regulator [Flavobacteriales bacterium]|nr:LexA family transcriptional regulator [Flavobacteriales bacterium]
MNYLSKNIGYLRKEKGLTQEQFADELKITRSRVGSYEEGRSEPSVITLLELSQFFNLPIDAIIQNDLTKSNNSSFIDIGNHRVLFPILVDDNNDNIIEVVPLAASAGYLKGYSDPEYITQLDKIKLPFVTNGKHRAFLINGDSMLPLKSGSYVIGRYVENLNEIKDGKTYVMITLNDGIVYKRVYDQTKKNQTLLLSSDNNTYSPYEIPVNDVMELWEFNCSIQNEEHDPDNLKINRMLKIIQDLQEEVATLQN